ncbi:MAG: phosphoglycerate dehydrogenase [Candidatus Melainabacteria bacterium RIFCSPHIGHO2_02_FULL_34_12]|nr:MAG: phosphoglycerate dehydrogenase [Candidatus Melainabacteria bacterium RIFCSPHIGHO2_02_FULL_34_12]
MPKVLVTDKLNEAGLNILKQVADVDYTPGISADELKKKIKDYDALLVRSQTKVTKEVIDACSSKMKIIGRAGVGVDNIDLEAATQKGIIVVNSPEGNTTAAAEHTIAMMMSLARQIPPADTSMKKHEWKRSDFMGFEVFNKTLGIVGLGKIGTRVGKIAQAIGMKIIAYDPFVSAELAAQLRFTLVPLDEIWQKSDIITFHVPKTPETTNLLNKETLKKCKKGVRIVNCARGGIIDEIALSEAIKSGHVAGAAFDVFNEEPVKDSPLLDFGNKVVLTPHLGASTEEAQLNVALDVAEQIRDVLTGGFARSAVNLPAMKPETIAEVKPFMYLASNLGTIAAQLVDGKIDEIQIEAKGELAKKDTAPLSVAVLKGVLSCSVEGVNFVNAPIIAKSRGIKVIESKSFDPGDYVEELKITIKTDKAIKIISGSLLAQGIPVIVQLDSYAMSATPAEHMLLTHHQDKPGMIAQVSTILWQGNVNISSMHVGRKGPREMSVMILNLDDPILPEIVKKVSEVEGVLEAKYVRLS